ncbi:hypothetical protein [Levilactobacillus tujiorum]|uniref:Uncharacterized protein n=1 Tax=Levilactobacillus tujiorum TaxID=2912243 RepID=A0ABX1L7D3_9LACO|nr:hypothetical protein [Levilactobacillus tujiorum]MCH5464030.1 hypothetical protein [Levilactobacillus tujiorum]NLR11132.1 hypothetical protein [Lactobacillus sp. HBUAS51387]NLR29015.1 hypothetical protein [Levilactobacillus tujiorum]NLR32184.1 hypothetical protein [Levilactobacillus tujiorum]
MQVFNRVLAVVAAVAVLGSGIFATQAVASTTNDNAASQQTLSQSYTQLIQKQTEPLK